MADRQRRCIATGEVKSPDRLIRFVVGPDQLLVPDIAGDLPGRGLWVSASASALRQAMAKRTFARAARSLVEVPADLVERVDGLLARRTLNLLGLARRGSQVAIGFEKVKTKLTAAPVAVLLSASDGAADGTGKLGRLAPGVPVVAMFSRDELSLALGRENVVHAALEPGRLANRFLAEVNRLRGFRETPPQTGEGRERRNASEKV